MSGILKKYYYNTLTCSISCVTFWILLIRDTETSVGKGGSKKLRAMKTYEKQKKSYQLCLLLFNNNVDLKNDRRNCRIFVSIRS